MSENKTKDKEELKKKINKIISKTKDEYNKLPEEKKVYVKYGGITLAGVLVGGVLGYLLGKK